MPLKQSIFDNASISNIFDNASISNHHHISAQRGVRFLARLYSPHRISLTETDISKAHTTQIEATDTMTIPTTTNTTNTTTTTTTMTNDNQVTENTIHQHSIDTSLPSDLYFPIPFQIPPPTTPS